MADGMASGMTNGVNDTSGADGVNDRIDDRLGRDKIQPKPDAPRTDLLESLSALMDDEAESLEVRRLVKAMADTTELAAHWRRYHAVRASLQHDVHQRPAVNLLPGIRAALTDQQGRATMPAGTIAGRHLAGRLARVAGQVAIAASVAVGVLVGYPVLVAGNGSISAPQVAVSETANLAPANGSMPALNGDFSASALTRTVSLDEAARDRLEKAVRNFSGSSAVIEAGTTPMFRNQLQPFAATPVSAPANSGQSRQ